MKSIWIIALLPAVTLMNAQAFVPAVQQSSDLSSAFLLEQRYQPTTSCIDVLHTGIKKLSIYDRSTSTTAIKMSDEDFAVDATHERIAQLVEEHSVVLFMKGSKLFPQCGFSNTATQILQSYNIDFHTVDVLAGGLFIHIFLFLWGCLCMQLAGSFFMGHLFVFEN